MFKKKVVEFAKKYPKWRIDREYLNSELELVKAVKANDKKRYKQAMKKHRFLESARYAKLKYY